MRDQLWHLACNIRELRRLAANAKATGWGEAISSLADDFDGILTEMTVLPGAFEQESGWRPSSPLPRSQRRPDVI